MAAIAAESGLADSEDSEKKPAPLVSVKVNVRMCGDCHDFFKAVSLLSEVADTGIALTVVDPSTEVCEIYAWPVPILRICLH